MSSEAEVKLLTLLNVCAVKRPRELDLPGGHRGSSSASPVPKGTRNRNGHGEEREVKKRRSVNFGGELGPSGSAWSKAKNKTKADQKNANRVASAHGMDNGVKANGHAGEGEYASGTEGLAADDEGSEDDAGPSSGQ